MMVGVSVTDGVVSQLMPPIQAGCEMRGQEREWRVRLVHRVNVLGEAWGQRNVDAATELELEEQAAATCIKGVRDARRQTGYALLGSRYRG